jgi:hypothetical protein
MNTTHVIKRKWFWAWQDEKEEAWLSEMAREGLHLEQVGLPGRYTFRKGEPENFIYRLDYQSLHSKDKESYLQLFEDAGWEHVGDMSGWVYFRIKSENGEVPEIYSDAKSKKGKYERIITYLIIILPICLFIRPDAPETASPYFFIIEGLWVVLVLLFVTAILQLMRRIGQLKE